VRCAERRRSQLLDRRATDAKIGDLSLPVTPVQTTDRSPGVLATEGSSLAVSARFLVTAESRCYGFICDDSGRPD
jgi:hypothetical protein